MKVRLVVFFLVSIQSVLIGQNIEHFRSKQAFEKAEKLQELYMQASGENKDEYKIQFFYELPSNFVDFNMLYGYKDTGDSIIFGLVYYDAVDHFKLLDELYFVLDEQVYFEKLISISLHGIWHADAVNYLKYRLNIKLPNKLLLFLNILSKYSNEEIKSFWYFYFDGPHPAEHLPQELEGIKELDERIYILMKSALKEVQQEWGVHGH